jgi:hypothetical protein
LTSSRFKAPKARSRPLRGVQSSKPLCGVQGAFGAFKVQGSRLALGGFGDNMDEESYRISSIVQTAWQTASSSFRESASILFLSLCFETARI